MHTRPVALVGALLAGILGASPSAQERPNFVFILVDDLGYMDIGANNPDCFYDTPNLDQLAASGMRFTAGYAANPVCSPSRYAIQTGKYPTRVDATNYFTGRRVARFRPAPLNNYMPPEEVTLAEALRAAGYRTAFAGKWHLGPSDEYWPRAQGYEINIGGHSRGHPRSYFSPYKNPRLADGPDGEHLPERLTTDCLTLIEQWRDEPFLLFLSFYSVHTPLQAPKDLISKYRNKAERTHGEPFGTEEQIWPTKKPRRVRILQRHATYAAMVESMDRQVGRILDKLDELELTNNTVICFTSDNGGLSTSEGMPTSNLPLRGGKGWLYEGGIREPFLVRWPNVAKPGSTCDVPVVGMDFYPTILEIAGLDPTPEQHRDGHSLVPLLRGGSELERDALFWHYPHYGNQGGFPGGVIRMGNYKLLERFEDGRVHLFDLSRDLGERNDLAQSEPRRVAAMRNRLHAWYREVDAKFLRAKEGGPTPWRPPE